MGGGCQGGGYGQQPRLGRPRSVASHMASAKSSRLRDRDIRAALAARVACDHGGDDHTRIVQELGLRSGRFRIDMAVVNGSIHGYEIKSAADTLQRLPAQAVCYGEICDFVTIVATANHLVGVRKIVPRWWGIVTVRSIAGGLSLRQTRRARQNPRIDPVAVAQLLWREEALLLLEERGLADGVRGKPRSALWRRLAERLPSDELMESVRNTLIHRPTWRVDPQPT